MKELHVYGDNIVECERMVLLVKEALSADLEYDSSASLLSPTYSCDLSSQLDLRVRCFPGHGKPGRPRWGVDLWSHLAARGAMLRENADVVLAEWDPVVSEIKVLCAVEFCGALPAGNQAWQRHGRALAFAQARVPYFIFTELGGTELDEARQTKAPRVPNPAVPFSLLKLSQDLGTTVLPVYEMAPSAPSELEARFRNALGRHLALKILRNLIETREIDAGNLGALKARTLEMVEILASSRKGNGTLSAEHWNQFLNSASQFDYLASKSVPWKKGVSEKVKLTSSATALLELVGKVGGLSLFSSNLRMAWLPAEKVKHFVLGVRALYESPIAAMLEMHVEANRPLVIVFVTGFKPRGDDSRPDRGLTPLARMLAGPNVTVLCVVSGPGKTALLNLVRTNVQAAARTNGLIESVMACADLLLIDSINCDPFILDVSGFQHSEGEHLLTGLPELQELSEHDIDTLTHVLFTQHRDDSVLEGLCNPPGGDWSGITLVDETGVRVRWTSLPREPSSEVKRPDHVIQLSGPECPYVLVLESKLKASDLEVDIGQRLVSYLKALLQTQPNVTWDKLMSEWRAEAGTGTHRAWDSLVSGAVFHFSEADTLRKLVDTGQVDVALAWEIHRDGSARLHVSTTASARFVTRDLINLVAHSNLRVEVQEE